MSYREFFGLLGSHYMNGFLTYGLKAGNFVPFFTTCLLVSIDRSSLSSGHYSCICALLQQFTNQGFYFFLLFVFQKNCVNDLTSL